MTASDHCSSREKTLANRGPSTHEAALVPNGPGIHEFGVSVQLVGNHFPTTDESFQDRGFGIVLRRRQQLPAFYQIGPATICAVHGYFLRDGSE
jgi:hypothetical protein